MNQQAIVFAIILIIFVVWILLRKQIRYWVELINERGWRSTIHYDRCLTIFKNLYTDINATDVSLKERKEKNIVDPTFTYGEVTFYSFVRILEKIPIKPDSIFYDLGSGAGKAVFIAALTFDFSKAYGIEKLESLYQLSESLLQKLDNLPERKKLLPHKSLNIDFLKNDFLEYDFSDGDVIFANATCFRGEMYTKLVSKLLQLKQGAYIILASANLDDIGGFDLMYNNLHLMSWGLSSVRIYQRI